MDADAAKGLGNQARRKRGTWLRQNILRRLPGTSHESQVGERQARRPDQRGQRKSRSAYFVRARLTRGVSQNDSDRFKDIPIDRRHLEAKAAKAKKGKLKRDIAGGIGRYDSPPSIKDFPKSWLPRPSDKPQTSPSAVSPHH